MNSISKHRGFGVALVASGILLVDTLSLLLVALWVWTSTGFHFQNLRDLWQTSQLPFLVYGIWILGIAGTISAIIAIVIYGFRERWFWRFLLIASLAWLAFPPIHALLGLLAFILLLKCQTLFPRQQAPESHVL